MKRGGARRLSEAVQGEIVAFPFLPTVRNARNEWAPAFSTVAEVVYFVGGSPFVRFFVLKGGDLVQTRELWVGSATPILSREEATHRYAQLMAEAARGSGRAPTR